MLGEPLDGQPPLAAAELWPIHRPLPSLAAPRQPLKFLETGIKVIDLLAPSLARAPPASLAGPASERRGPEADRFTEGSSSQTFC